jgi:hypothetical protein
MKVASTMAARPHKHSATVRQNFHSPMASASFFISGGITYSYIVNQVLSSLSNAGFSIRLDRKHCDAMDGCDQLACETIHNVTDATPAVPVRLSKHGLH